MKIIIIILTLLITSPLTVNANEDYEEWQLELLEIANLEIKPLSNYPSTFKNDILEIDGEYYLVEVVGIYNPDWETISGWSLSSYGYYRTNNIDVNIPIISDGSFLRNDMASNLLDISTFNNVMYSTESELDLFTVNQGGYNLSIRINGISSINELQSFLNNNNFTIYYKLDEPHYTLLDWYDPPTPPVEGGQIIPGNFIIIGTITALAALAFIAYKSKGAEPS